MGDVFDHLGMGPHEAAHRATERTRAARTVCSAATDAAEARELLAMLGLIGDATEAPSSAVLGLGYNTRGGKR